MARIGLLGGAFDPPHDGHVAVASAILRARLLDRVDLVVSGASPHRDSKSNVAAPEDRAAMARLAVQDVPGLGVELCELARTGPSYTIETLRQLKAAVPGNTYSLIIGADMVVDLPRWREVNELLALAEVIPVLRPGFGAEVFAALERHLGKAVADGLRAALVAVPQLGISSTSVRAAVAAGESIAGMVPAAVEKFIYARGLYRSRPAPA